MPIAINRLNILLVSNLCDLNIDLAFGHLVWPSG